MNGMSRWRTVGVTNDGVLSAATSVESGQRGTINGNTSITCLIQSKTILTFSRWLLVLTLLTSVAVKRPYLYVWALVDGFHRQYSGISLPQCRISHEITEDLEDSSVIKQVAVAAGYRLNYRQDDHNQDCRIAAAKSRDNTHDKL